MGPGFRMPPYRQQREEIPKEPKAFFRYCRKQIGSFFFRLSYIYRLIWETNPWILAALAVLCALNGFLPVAGALISRELINALVAAFTGPAGTQLRDFLNSSIITLLILQFSFQLCTKLVTQLNTMISRLAGEKVVNHIRLKIIAKSKELDTESFDNPEFYERLENANREAGNRPISILNSTFSIISTAISMISFIAIVAVISPWAPLVVIALAFPSAIINFVYRKRTFYYIRHASKERRQMAYYSDVLVNRDVVKEVKLLRLHDYFRKKYREVFAKYFTGLKKLIIQENVWHLIISVLHALATILLFAYVAFKVWRGELEIGDYTLYTGALTSISNYVTSLISTSATVYEGTLFIDNMILFMKETQRIVPRIDPPKQPTKHQSHEIEFRHVSFHYPGSDRMVIQDISFTLRGDETAVLVGLNGAGKTTLIKLLTRLYDPTEGQILLDGTDLRDYDVEKLYDLFGIIFQDFGRYAVSVRDNIAFGDVSRGIDEKNIREAARQADADSFIETLPKKYDTPLMRFFEMDGTELSTGQWQKLSIARAFYKDSDILILDEPTASLDPLAEQEIFNQFDQMRKGKITMFVSHRLSSATTADKILVIEGGRLVECGSHAELMHLKGKYEHLFSTQAKRYQEEMQKSGTQAPEKE